MVIVLFVSLMSFPGSKAISSSSDESCTHILAEWICKEVDGVLDSLHQVCGTVLNDWVCTPESLEESCTHVFAPNVCKTIGHLENRCSGSMRDEVCWSEELVIPPTGGTASFGESVTIFGETAVVGARGPNYPLDVASDVYIYERTDTSWIKTERISGSGHFGRSVAIDENFLAVGASGYPRGTQGAVFIYERVDGGWREHSVLRPDNPSSNHHFGKEVLLHNGTLAVGATGEDSVFVYSLMANVWVKQLKRTGNEIALFENTLLISVQDDDRDVLQFLVKGHDGWSIESQFELDQYMQVRSIALHGNTAFVGTNGGELLVLNRTGGKWFMEAQFDNGDFAETHDISLDDGRAVVASQDKIFLFERTNGVWREISHIEVPSPLSRQAVGINDDFVIVGNPNFAPALYGLPGVVFIYKLV